MITITCGDGLDKFKVDIDENDIETIQTFNPDDLHKTRIVLTDGHYWLVHETIAELLIRS